MHQVNQIELHCFWQQRETGKPLQRVRHRVDGVLAAGPWQPLRCHSVGPARPSLSY